MQLALTALGRHAATRPDDAAFHDGAETITFRQLAGRVGGLARRLKQRQRVAIFGAASIDWVVADLAAAAAGATAIPLPMFFSAEQTTHLLGDAEIEAILADPDSAAAASALSLPIVDTRAATAPLRGSDENAEKIVYTSGSTGRPKGVRLAAAQIDVTCRGLIEASQATAADRHLSVLPYALLLENIAGIYLPLIVGGSCRIAKGIAAARSPVAAIVELMHATEAARPTTMVLVPELLRGWIAGLELGRAKVPVGLRFVAVGGAPVASALAARAWKHGIPVHEGYGLSECCSVVAVNRPGRRKSGTVGEPLSGTDVTIEDGEIVVRSASVMRGYLGQAPAEGVWRTGDLGAFDAEGYLRVLGRKDSLLVLSNGRNVSPEWVEAVLLVDPRISRCVVLGHGRPYLVAIVTPSVLGADWLGAAAGPAQEALLADLCAALPAYARPRRMLVISDDVLRDNSLLTGNGRPRRRDIARHFADAIDRLYAIPDRAEKSNGLV